MKKPVFWVILTVASGVAALYITWMDGTFNGEFLDDFLPYVLGVFFGLVIIPVVALITAVFIGKTAKRRFSDAAQYGLVAIVWGVLVVSSVTVTSSESPAGYVFRPKGCEYAVQFPDAPKLYTTDIENSGGELIPLHGAELSVASGVAFLRAECGAHPEMSKTGPNKEQMYEYMKLISSRLGLELPVLDYRVERSGVVASLTGTKRSEKGLLTIRVINHVGDASTMTLYIGSASGDFMTPEMRKFVMSVNK
jgi:hypothetical protein